MTLRVYSVAALVLLSCSAGYTSPPGALVSVSPDSVVEGEPTSLIISGTGFRARIVADLDDPNRSERSTDYVVKLSGQGTDLTLSPVTRTDDAHLEAPFDGSLPVGTYTLSATDPWRRALDGALSFTVKVRPCVSDAECADSDPCSQDACEGGACRHTHPTDRCGIAGACVDAGAVGPQGCLVCDPSASTSGWSQTADSCLIAGQCVDAGSVGPQSCFSCDPSSSRTDWTQGADSCLIGGQCVDAGSVGPQSCLSCDPSASRTDWTQSADSCLISGQCIDAGTPGPQVCLACAPLVTRTNWSVTAGAMCNDGRSCTTSDVCDGAGTCSGVESCATPPSTCYAAVGACGVSDCQYTPLAGGQGCDDAIACTQGETCDSLGNCGGGAWICGSIPPRACLTATPTLADPNVAVSFDATCSSDLDTPLSQLTARFDWDGDGVFDTAPSSPLTATHAFATTGIHIVTVEVADPSGNRDTTTTAVAVMGTPDDVVVTTAADENNTNATPQQPGGAGLSLREAINFVNGLSTPRTITFSGPMTIAAAPMPSLTNVGSAIFGSAGVVLDFSLSAGAGPCVELNGNNQGLYGVELRGCNGSQYVQLKGANAVVAYCTFIGYPSAPEAIKFSAGPATFGPGNVVRDFTGGPSMKARAPGISFIGNLFSHNYTAIDLGTGADAIVVHQNEFTLHTSPAITAATPAGTAHIAFNTFADGTVGIAGSTAGKLTVIDDIFYRHSGCALAQPASAYVMSSPNLYFALGGTGCAEVRTTDGGNVLADPVFVGADAGDLRLLTGSPAINAGVDAGVDTNGIEPGLWYGAAPDLGAHEAP